MALPATRCDVAFREIHEGGEVCQWQWLPATMAGCCICICTEPYLLSGATIPGVYGLHALLIEPLD